jgi:hypothetical protein
MTKHITRNLHVPLPDATYRQLRIEAQRSNRPATEIAREAIDRWLAEQRRLLVHESVMEYALDLAGSPADLDEQLEAAGIESLLAMDPSARPDQHT